MPHPYMLYLFDFAAEIDPVFINQFVWDHVCAIGNMSCS
jgi:hypothetical protein